MKKGYDFEELGRARVIDTMTFENAGYLFDMPIVHHTLKSYTTFNRTPLVFNISNDKIIK